MRRQNLKHDLYSQISTIGQSSSSKRGNLNIDDLIYQFKMRKSNQKLAKQYSEIIKIFDKKQSPKQPFNYQSTQLHTKVRLRTDESQEPFQFQETKQRLLHQIDIHQIINETSPIKITPRLNYENFKTFQETERKSYEQNNYHTHLANFGPLSSSNQCETDEEIKQISQQSVQKLSKFRTFEQEQFQTCFNKVISKLEKLNLQYQKQGFLMIKFFSKWTLKEKATKMYFRFFERKISSYFDLFKIYEPSIEENNHDNQNIYQRIQTDNVLSPINMNTLTFLIPTLKPVTQFGAMNFEEYLKKKNQNIE
ncbi:unnamed protein product (macronuclear) [Paramecium tetraurelia]|uniref:SPX domain-containing protein n=1 Tax=Paramecium tetraurelia TaxID=5888 RepID=A0E5A5_PARTE|nr:uncharacterized protein GSPATT00023649001 [Paramecium tetraurelia]CAK90472.1 unnamed protein product [Paramecium tetraurelia]|eukprot:XP_001457869.1 hypothetical protein (macronuclear) [Paramecium tetraurelia strain d4-2]